MEHLEDLLDPYVMMMMMITITKSLLSISKHATHICKESITAMSRVNTVRCSVFDPPSYKEQEEREHNDDDDDDDGNEEQQNTLPPLEDSCSGCTRKCLLICAGV